MSGVQPACLEPVCVLLRIAGSMAWCIRRRGELDFTQSSSVTESSVPSNRMAGGRMIAPEAGRPHPSLWTADRQEGKEFQPEYVSQSPGSHLAPFHAKLTHERARQPKSAVAMAAAVPVTKRWGDLKLRGAAEPSRRRCHCRPSLSATSANPVAIIRFY